MVGSMLPMLAVEDVKRTLEFYEEKLGFEIGTVTPSRENPMFADVSKFGATLEFESLEGINRNFRENERFDPRAKRGVGVIFYIVVGKDIDRYYEELRRRGIRIIQEIADQPWGARTFTIEDVNGYRICFRT